MPAPRFVLDDFWPSDLFLGGIPGAWYDPTDLSTMFQDSTGTTPVTAVEQPVGLILDKSQGLTLGAELVTNGNFSSGTAGWTAIAGATLSIDAGRLKVAQGLTDFVSASQGISTIAGRTYKVTFDLISDGTSSPSFVVYARQFAGSTNIAFSSSGFGNGKSFYFTAVGATTYIEPGSATSADNVYGLFDNVSVVELAGNHASQSTAASRPTYRARYNLLTYSEQFNDAYWFKAGGTISANTTLAPDGTTTADTWTATAGAARHELLSGIGAGPTTTANANHTFTLYVKKGTHNFVSLLVTANNTTWYVATFDFSGATPVVSKTGAGAGGVLVSTSIEAAANGFWRLGVTGRTTDAVSVCCPVLASSATPTYGIYGEENWTAAGTETAIFWGAQLLTAADVTATGNAYQRIAAATVYDTAPIFRPYLAFDGLDDSLSTAAINFTSTDKMTVFAGASKLSDAAVGILAELSADANSNAGSWFMAAPVSTFANGDYGWKTRGTVNASGIWGVPVLAPNTSVLTGIGEIATDTAILRRNGAQYATGATDQGAGNYGNYAMFIGRRGGASLPLNGRLYSLIVRGAASSVTEIADTELWVNARTGAY